MPESYEEWGFFFSLFFKLSYFLKEKKVHFFTVVFFWHIQGVIWEVKLLQGNILEHTKKNMF